MRECAFDATANAFGLVRLELHKLAWDVRGPSAKRIFYFFLPSRLMNIWRQRNVLLVRCQCAFVAIKREQLPNIHTLIKTIIHTINDTSNTIWGRSNYMALEKMHNFYFNWIWVWALSWFSFQPWNGELCMLDAEEAHYWHEDVCMTIVQNAQWKGYF